MLQKKLLGRKVCSNPFISTTGERKDTSFCACPLKGHKQGFFSYARVPCKKALFGLSVETQQEGASSMQGKQKSSIWWPVALTEGEMAWKGKWLVSFLCF